MLLAVSSPRFNLQLRFKRSQKWGGIFRLGHFLSGFDYGVASGGVRSLEMMSVGEMKIVENRRILKVTALGKMKILWIIGLGEMII